MSVFLIVSEASGQGKDTIMELPAVLPNSAIRNLEISDSFSRMGDSVRSAEFYLKIDPFFFVSSNYTIGKMESALKEFRLPKAAAQTYREIFAKAYNAKRTEPYTVFRRMLEEDQMVRRKLGACADSLSCAILEWQMQKTDSPHFEYLYQYVIRNGWPSYEDGAAFAEIIAMHDFQHMRLYLPYIRREVISGRSSSRFYDNLKNRAYPSNLAKLDSYRNKKRFDVSCILKGSKPSATLLNEIISAVTSFKPIKHQYFVFESASEEHFKEFMHGDKSGNHEIYWKAWDLLVSISQAHNDNIPYSFLYSEKQGPDKLVLYLVY
ncbi:MAG: hypothetical protein JNM41_10395 [Flavipsychrobacter sp.]|nr:hypothetical protein [Flavipsychrobacter sp.]